MHSSGHTQRVFLRDLKPSTTYYYRVEANGKPISAIESFQTKGMSASAAAPSSAATNANFQVVAGPVAEKITNNSAEVWYAVDKPTDTLVRYGVDPNVMAMHAPPEKLAGERSYKATITNLRPNTTYYVAVAHPNGTIVERANFKTEPANFNEQAQKVRITNGPVFEQVASDNAIIAWSTNIAASTTVHYGTDVNIIGHTAQGAAGTNHRVLIKGLQPNTRYFFRVESTSAQGPAAVARSEPFHFKTEAPGQAALSMPQLH